MSIEDKRDQLTEELMPFEDHLERFAYIIDRAKDAPGLDQEYKIDTFLIKGCVSQLWIFPQVRKRKMLFSGRLRRLHNQGNRHPFVRTLQRRKPAGCD